MRIFPPSLMSAYDRSKASQRRFKLLAGIVVIIGLIWMLGWSLK